MQAQQEVKIESEVKVGDNLQNKTYYDLNTALENKRNVKSLVLREKNLDKFPTEIFELASLEYLDLSMNNLHKIPDNFSKLENLTGLNISHNSISEIPKSLKGLDKLEDFALAFNDISKLPSSICQLDKLRKLNLSKNDILNIDECIGELKLEKLALIPKSKDPNYLRSKYQSLFDQLINCKVVI